MKPYRNLVELHRRQAERLGPRPPCASSATACITITLGAISRRCPGLCRGPDRGRRAAWRPRRPAGGEPRRMAGRRHGDPYRRRRQCAAARAADGATDPLPARRRRRVVAVRLVARAARQGRARCAANCRRCAGSSSSTAARRTATPFRGTPSCSAAGRAAPSGGRTARRERRSAPTTWRRSCTHRARPAIPRASC